MGPDEKARIAALEEYDIIGTAPERAFDDIAAFAAELCDTPIALISFVETSRQWFKSRVGLAASETPREQSFCVYCMERDDIMEVPDATRDPRFRDNPLVTGEPHIRFYAGYALRAPTGEALGSLCVIDRQPRAGLDKVQRSGLRVLADQVMAQLELKRAAVRARQREDYVARALRASRFVGTWNWEVAANLVTADGHFADLYGVAPEAAAEGIPIERFIEGIHPDDRPQVEENIQTALATGGEYRNEHRLLRPDGTVRWVLVDGRCEFDAQGAPRNFPGVAVDITDQKSVVVELALSEARFRALADTMPQMVWSTLPDGYHDYYNKRWYEFTGMPEGSTDGEAWNGMFHEEDQAIAKERWSHSLATGEPYEIEYRLRHHSGHYRWTLGRALPIRDVDGRIVRWFGTCTDIHEARQVAAEKELVAQELSHRIKNIFSVVAGLVSLSGRTNAALRQPLDELRGRVMALGRAHDFVRPHSRQSRRSGSINTLHGLLGELFAPYRDSDGDRIQVSGDDLPIDDRAATPLALLFHELATNAAKYGALSTREGRVTCRSRREGDAISIRWQELGGPEVKKPESTGFGTKVTQMSAEAQLGGKIDWNWEVAGLIVAIEVPITSFNREFAGRP